MTDKLRQAAEMALEELENHSGNYKLSKAEGVQHTAVVDAIRQALAEPEQTPVAYMGTDAEGNPNKFRLGSFGSSIALYTKEQL